MMLVNLLWLQLGMETVGLVDLFVLSTVISSDGDEGLLCLTSGSLSFRNG